MVLPLLAHGALHFLSPSPHSLFLSATWLAASRIYPAAASLSWVLQWGLQNTHDEKVAQRRNPFFLFFMLTHWGWRAVCYCSITQLITVDASEIWRHYLQPTRTVSGLQQVLNKRLLMLGNTKWSTLFLDCCSHTWMIWITTRLIVLGYSEKVMKTFRKCWSGQGRAEWMKRATSGSTDWQVPFKPMFSTVTPLQAVYEIKVWRRTHQRSPWSLH